MSNNSGATKGKAILVVGMHRSGTSALTRVLNLLGVSLGEGLLPSASDNEVGFWESEDVVSIHDSLLAELGRTWEDLRPLPEGWMDTDACRKARAELTALMKCRFSSKSLWAVKDPRLCLFLPLWKVVLSDCDIQPCVVMSLRHPDEIASSLAKRDGLAPEHARLLWLRYMANAEFHSRSLPRVVVRYEILLQNWKRATDHVCQTLGLVWLISADEAGKDIEEFLDKSLRHHNEPEPDSNSDKLPDLIRSLYLGLVTAARNNGAWSQAQAATDDYCRVSSIFDGALITAYLGRSELEGIRLEINDIRRQHEVWLAGVGQVAANMLLRTVNKSKSSESIEIAPSMAGVSELYFTSEMGGYTPSQAIKIAHEGLSIPKWLSFELPTDVVIHYIRFDPAHEPGVFVIAGLRVNGVPVNNFRSCVTSLRQFELQSCSEDELRMASLDGDPQVCLDLRAYADNVPIETIELMCWQVDLAFGRSQLMQVSVQETVRAALQQLSASGEDRASHLSRMLNIHAERVQEFIKEGVRQLHTSGDVLTQRINAQSDNIQKVLKEVVKHECIEVMNSQAELLGVLQNEVNMVNMSLESSRSKLDEVSDEIAEMKRWQQLSLIKRWRKRKHDPRH